MRISPDFSERKLVPGKYNAVIVGCEQKTSAKGNSYLNWKLETQTLESATTGHWVYLMTGLSGKGAQILKTLIQCAKDPNYQGGDIDTDELINSHVTITVDKGIKPDGSESPYMVVTAIAPSEHVPAGDDFDSNFGPA